MFRRSDVLFDALIGQQLLGRLNDHLRSELCAATLRPANFDDGRHARWEGDWNVQEDWGCWIGMKGATLRFVSHENAAFEACLSHMVVGPFRGAALNICANGVSTRRRLTDAPDVALLRFEFTSVVGENLIRFAGSPTMAQAAASLAIDGRGLMIASGKCAFIMRVSCRISQA